EDGLLEYRLSAFVKLLNLSLRQVSHLLKDELAEVVFLLLNRAVGRMLHRASVVDPCDEEAPDYRCACPDANLPKIIHASDWISTARAVIRRASVLRPRTHNLGEARRLTRLGRSATLCNVHALQSRRRLPGLRARNNS